MVRISNKLNLVTEFSNLCTKFSTALLYTYRGFERKVVKVGVDLDLSVPDYFSRHHQIAVKIKSLYLTHY
jgi:hypothetical protein